MRYNSTCGLGPGEVAELTARIFQVLTGRGPLPRWKVPLGRQVEIVLVMLRQNLPQQLVADLCGVSQPTVSRIFRRIVPLLEQVTCLHGADLASQTAGRVIPVDGTYVPTGNRAATGRDNYSGKHHVQCLNIQVAATLDGHLLAVSDPVPGARHDAGALHATGWNLVLDDVQWIGDSAPTTTNSGTAPSRPCAHPSSASSASSNAGRSSPRAGADPSENYPASSA
ncbi:DDE superfamily endonuclease [Luteimicrobium subarcticum]|uniref:DDE superfamily endonuclease n=1 Tax=Luteimicrobium subarcticum TaxID=620910 RepID=A0A2M8WWA4_9MICO|nr:DDE superfamily endonuclease [Luteimicrobium subarcticum]